METTQDISIKKITLEITIYGIIIVIYTLLILKPMIQPLGEIYHMDIIYYTIIALILILGQGMLLEYISTHLREKIEIE